MHDSLDWRRLIVSGGNSAVVLVSIREVEEFYSYNPNKCAHVKVELRDYRTSNGGWQRKKQCLTCGLATSNPQRRNPDESVPVWDKNLSKSFEIECRAFQEELLQHYLERTEELTDFGYREYQVYLKSEEWENRRKLVIDRDNGICQACLERKATEVHHLTYDHILEEFMFELISVCRNCHERLHRKKIISKEAARAKGKI